MTAHTETNYMIALFHAVNNAVMSGNNQMLADGTLTQGQAQIENTIVNSWTISLPNGMKISAAFGWQSMTISQFASLFAKDIGSGKTWSNVMDHNNTVPLSQLLALTSLNNDLIALGFSKNNFTEQDVRNALSKYLHNQSPATQRQWIEQACNELKIAKYTATAPGTVSKATLTQLAAAVAKSPKNSTLAALYRQAQTNEQQAVQTADGGTKAGQTQMTQDVNNNQQKATLLQSLISLLQSCANGTIN